MLPTGLGAWPHKSQVRNPNNAQEIVRGLCRFIIELPLIFGRSFATYIYQAQNQNTTAGCWGDWGSQVSELRCYQIDGLAKQTERFEPSPAPPVQAGVGDVWRFWRWWTKHTKTNEGGHDRCHGWSARWWWPRSPQTATSARPVTKHHRTTVKREKMLPQHVFPLPPKSAADKSAATEESDFLGGLIHGMAKLPNPKREHSEQNVWNSLGEKYPCFQNKNPFKPAVKTDDPFPVILEGCLLNGGYCKPRTEKCETHRGSKLNRTELRFSISRYNLKNCLWMRGENYPPKKKQRQIDHSREGWKRLKGLRQKRPAEQKEKRRVSGFTEIPLPSTKKLAENAAFKLVVQIWDAN